jgi:hypothetical protein
MVEDKLDTFEATVQSARDCWRQASRDVLGFELDADAKRCTSPNRYEDEDGRTMWEMLIGLLEKAEQGLSAAA